MTQPLANFKGKPYTAKSVNARKPDQGQRSSLKSGPTVQSDIPVGTSAESMSIGRRVNPA
jgi:hypothetical protein